MESNNLRFVNDNVYDLAQEDRVVSSYLYDKYGEQICRLKGLMVDPETWEVRYAVFVDGGFLFTDGKTVLLPRPLFYVIDMGKIKTNWSRESLQHAPTIESVEDVSLKDERAILSYFDLSPYWEDAPTDTEVATEETTE